MFSLSLGSLPFWKLPKFRARPIFLVAMGTVRHLHGLLPGVFSQLTVVFEGSRKTCHKYDCGKNWPCLPGGMVCS